MKFKKISLSYDCRENIDFLLLLLQPASKVKFSTCSLQEILFILFLKVLSWPVDSGLSSPVEQMHQNFKPFGRLNPMCSIWTTLKIPHIFLTIYTDMSIAMFVFYCVLNHKYIDTYIYYLVKIWGAGMKLILFHPSLTGSFSSKPTV